MTPVSCSRVVLFCLPHVLTRAVRTKFFHIERLTSSLSAAPDGHIGHAGERATLISLITIPLSPIAAGLVLYLRGATLNMMVLIGLVIAIGVIVDDAIIVVENIMRRLRHLQGSGTGEVPRSS